MTVDVSIRHPEPVAADGASPRIRLASAAAVAGAILFGAPSLSYPLTSDQGVYFYVAREWLMNGAIPYRDTFDHKPPGIYVIYGLAIRLFGDVTWGIRVLELLCVPLVGWLASRLDLSGSSRHSAKLMFLSAILYWGFLNFVDTAQTELWCVLFALASAYFASRAASRWAAVSGVFLSLAMLMKPTAGLFALPIALHLSGAGHRAARLRAWALGIVTPWISSVVYFAAHHSLGAAFDIVFTANTYYVAHDHIGAVGVVSRLIGLFRHYMPFSVVLTYGLFALHRNRRRTARGRWHLVVWLVTGLLAAVVQMKFYVNHFTLLLGPVLLVAREVMTEIGEWLHARGMTKGRAEAFIVVNAMLLLAVSWSGEHLWFGAARDVLLERVGLLSNEKLRARWARNEISFDQRENEQVAEWIQAHASTHDSVCVRGAESEIYALARRRCSSPFFWTTWLTAPSRAYRRTEWLAADRAALEHERPRFVIARREARVGDVDHPSFAEELGYARQTEIGRYVVLEDVRAHAPR